MGIIGKRSILHYKFVIKSVKMVEEELGIIGANIPYRDPTP